MQKNIRQRTKDREKNVLNLGVFNSLFCQHDIKITWLKNNKVSTELFYAYKVKVYQAANLKIIGMNN